MEQGGERHVKRVLAHPTNTSVDKPEANRFDKCVDNVDWIHCVDPSRSMRDGCIEVLQGMIGGDGMEEEEGAAVAAACCSKDALAA